MVSPGAAATLIGIASGVGTTLANLYIAKKTKGRTEFGKDEVVLAMGAAAIGSLSAYLFIKSREQAIEEGLATDYLV